MNKVDKVITAYEDALDAKDKEISELKTDNTNLKALVVRLKDANSLYAQTNFSGIEIPGDIEKHLKIEVS